MRRLSGVSYAWFLFRERLPYLVVGAAALLLGGLFLVFTTTGQLRLGSGQPRPVHEQQALLANGDCATTLDGRPLGRIQATLTASSGNPYSRYQVALLDRRQVVHYRTGEVRVIPCAELQTQQPR
jgi:hypothetical protein